MQMGFRVMKKEFNEAQREYIANNAHAGIDEADYYKDKVAGWVNKYEKYARTGIHAAAINYFGGVSNHMVKSERTSMRYTKRRRRWKMIMPPSLRI